MTCVKPSESSVLLSEDLLIISVKNKSSTNKNLKNEDTNSKKETKIQVSTEVCDPLQNMYTVCIYKFNYEFHFTFLIPAILQMIFNVDFTKSPNNGYRIHSITL